MIKLLQKLESKEAQFKDVLEHIDTHYVYTASGFQNGNQQNAETENQGSARVLAFASLHQLSKEETLKLFAEHYDSVLSTPDGTDHQNIRQFMQYGWDGVRFENNVLTAK